MNTQERIARLQKQSLGLSRSEVRIATYDHLWKRAFSDEAHAIYCALKIERAKLYHMGSTSILGLSAKPIIDILGAVPSLADYDQVEQSLRNIGYETKGEYGIAGRRYAVLYNAQKTEAYVHLHIYQAGDPQIAAHLEFRDLLRSNPTLTEQYATEKQRLAKHTNRSDYSEAKAPIIQKISALAGAKREIKAESQVAILGNAKGGNHTEYFLREKFPRADFIDLKTQRILPYIYGAEGEAQNDHFLALAERMAATREIIFATPVYWYSMSAPLKLFFDRFSNLLRGPSKHLGEALYGKQMRLVATGYDDALPQGFEVPFASTALYFGMDYLGADYRSYKS